MSEKKTEQMPPTGITLGEAKQYLSEKFVKYTIAHVNAKAGLYFGLDVWDVSALEEVPNVNSVRKRNFRLYTKGLDDDAKAYWEATQGPMPAPVVTPEPTFLDGAMNYIREEVKTNKIKAGELIYGDDQMERATATIIGIDGAEKYVVIKQEAAVFSMENYTPVKIMSKQLLM